MRVPAPAVGWSLIASSLDGTQLVAAAGGINGLAGPIYASSDSGKTWRSTGAPQGYWSSLASSGDGTLFAATTSADFPTGTPNGRIYIGNNAGVTWIAHGAPSNA